MHKHGLRALGVSLVAVLGLMAFFAVAAQAENLKDSGTSEKVAGNFRIEGSTALVIGAEFTGSQEGAGTLLIAAKNAFIECKKGQVSSGKGIKSEVIKGELNAVEATVLFEECAAFEDKLNAEKKFPPLTACPVEGESAGKKAGVVEAKGIGKAKLHEGELYVLLTGAPFAVLKFGAECGIGVKVNVSGSVVALVTTGSTEEKEHLITFSEAIQKLFQVLNGSTVEGDRLLYGASEAFVNASATVKLIGAHKEKVWSVI